MGEDVVEGLLGGYLSAGDVGKVSEDESEVLGKEVTTESCVESVEYALEVGMGTGKCFIMTDRGDDDIIFCKFGDISCLEDGLFEEVNIDILLGTDGKMYDG